MILLVVGRDRGLIALLGLEAGDAVADELGADDQAIRIAMITVLLAAIHDLSPSRMCASAPRGRSR